jgi:hypothetical protein
MTEVPTPIPVFTGRYRAVYDCIKAGHDLPVLPVVTSVGLPRYIAEARDWHKAAVLAPYGIVGKTDSQVDFEDLYRARLDKKGVEFIHETLLNIWSAQNPGSWSDTPLEERKPLVLLCFEDLDAGEWCHRRMFAAWYELKTTQVIPDLNTVEAVMAVLARP